MVRDPSVAVARNIMLSRSTLHTLHPPLFVVFTSKGASRPDAEPSDVDLERTRQ